jgi:hypothetical protein
MASAKDTTDISTLVSYGENISPLTLRKKGYSLGMLAVFPGVDHLEKLEGTPFEAIKEKIRPLGENVIDLDFVV